MTTSMFVSALLVGAQRQRLAHDLVEVDHRARRLPLARERQQVADDARGALGFAEDDVDAAPRRVVERLLGQPLGPAQDRRQRVVQLVRDAGDRLAERRHLFRLQQLLVEVARLIVELLALADVAHQRLDAQGPLPAPPRLGARGDLDPDDAAVEAPQPQQIVGDRPVRRAAARERRSRAAGSAKRSSAKGSTPASGDVGGVAEDQLEMRVGGERGRRVTRHLGPSDPM